MNPLKLLMGNPASLIVGLVFLALAVLAFLWLLRLRKKPNECTGCGACPYSKTCKQKEKKE